jgi:spore maturation protein CgeB
MNIALVFDKDRSDTTGNYFQRVLEETQHRVIHFWTRDSRTIPEEFDLYFKIDHGEYKYDIPKNLHPSAFYIIDTHLKEPYRKIKKQATHYDFLFCAQKEGARRLEKDTGKEVLWVPLACDLQIHRKIETEKIFDIGFVGTQGKFSLRKVILEMLKIRYPNSFLGKADFTKITEIYSASKIGFNYSIGNDINMRCFEILASGSLLVTNYIQDNGFDELFKDRENLVVYRNIDELLYLIDYYLRHDSERGGIAKNGYELVVSRHTYWHRLKAMFDYISNKLGNGYEGLRL